MTIVSGQSAFATTIKTNHFDVNLWSEPNRETADKIGKIERYEEVEVLGTKKRSNGQIWRKVLLRRSPGWRAHDRIGWVDSKFFTEIGDVNSDDESQTEFEASDCKECRKPRSSKRSKNLDHLSAVADSITKKRSKSGFIWPVSGVIRSAFGMRRHPITGMVKLHNGIDIAGNNGKPVLAAKAGKVISSRRGCVTGQKSCNGGAGNIIVIDHGDGTQTKYMHLNPSCSLARQGSSVQQGQKIACVGSTGASTGPHLHFSVLVHGRYVNPLTMLNKRR